MAEVYKHGALPALGLVVGQRYRGQAGVRVVHVVEHEVTTAVAMRDHADRTTGGRHQVVANTDTRQRSLFHPYAHDHNVNPGRLRKRTDGPVRWSRDANRAIGRMRRRTR